jgi:hypothetical protein
MKKIFKKVKTGINKIFKRIKSSKKPKIIFNKIKEVLLHITDKDYLKENIREVILVLMGFIFLLTIIVYLALSRNISKIEEEKINKETRPYANYIEDIVDNKSKELDKYIIYSLDYYKNVYKINELSSKEIKEFLNSKLNKKVKEEEIVSYGVNPTMVDRNIVFDVSSNKYRISEIAVDRQAIAKKEITYYKQVKLTKINKNKYKIKYEKYTIEDPYEILDYFLEANRTDEGEQQKDGSMKYDLVDITELKEYLTTGDISYLKAFLNKNDQDIKKFAKKRGKIKITYVIGDNNEVEIYKIK